LTNRKQISGKLKPLSKDSVRIIDNEGSTHAYAIREIIQLEEVNEKFWSRFRGAFDVGFNLTKAKNNRQLTYSGNLNYSSDK